MFAKQKIDKKLKELKSSWRALENMLVNEKKEGF